MNNINEPLVKMINQMKQIIQTLPEEQRDVKGPKLKFMRDIILDPEYVAIKQGIGVKPVAQQEPRAIPSKKVAPPRVSRMKIEVAKPIEETHAAINMSSALENIKENVPTGTTGTVQKSDVATLVTELEATKSQLPVAEVKPTFIVKQDMPKKPAKKTEPSGIDLVLKLEKAATGEQSMISSEKREKLSVVPSAIQSQEPSPVPVEPHKEMDQPTVEMAGDPQRDVDISGSGIQEFFEEEEYLYLPAEYLKEISLPDEITLENARILVEELKKRDLTEEQVIEVTGLSAGAMYQVLEWLKENELLLVTKKNFQIRYVFPEISVERWNTYIIPHKEDLAVETPTYYEEIDEHQIMYDLKPHCPICKKIIEEREIKLLIKGFEPECPACGNILTPKDIGR
ncbi:MAG: hypothetical protein ACTSRW_03455 [Candidatus Helarchaeota archaeon]